MVGRPENRLSQEKAAADNQSTRNFRKTISRERGKRVRFLRTYGEAEGTRAAALKQRGV